MTNSKRRTYRDLAIGILAVGILTCVKVFAVEDSGWGRWFDARGYEFLHAIISPFNPDKELSVVVLDISDLKREPDGTTPTKALQDIVKALVESHAKAIAIDIDFSPRIDAEDPIRTGARAEDDGEFFAFLHEQRNRRVPVFVGSFNVGPEPQTWLGLEENKDLAADMTLFDEDTTELPRWIRCSPDVKLNSISMALAEASDQRPAPKPFLRQFVRDPEVVEHLKPKYLENTAGQKILCQRAFTFVNYAKLALIRKLTLQGSGRDAVLSAKDENGKSRFDGKLVIIGNTQRGKFTDGFIVTRREPIAGAYLHASATYSLVDEPIYRFKHWVTVMLDVVLGFALVLSLFCVRLRQPRGKPSSYLSEGLIIFCLAAITLVSACLLVRFFDVLWLDVSLVVIALLLHSKVQEGIEWIPKRFFVETDNLEVRE